MVDPWTTPIAQEFPTQEPDTLRRLWGIIAAQKREMFDLRASVLANVSGIVADLTAKQAALEAQQAALAAQNAQILALIGSELYPQREHVDARGFTLTPGANVEKVRTTISVPSGYTQAIVYATAMLSAYNSTTVKDDMYLGASINGAVIGYAAQTTVANGSTGVATKAQVSLLTGLGSSFYVMASASSYLAAWTDVWNTVDLDVMAIFLR